MKIMERSQYLDKLKRLKGTPDMKVITGVRRSGKSRLMDSYIDCIENHEPDVNIIYIDFTSLQFEELKEYHTLNKYVEEHYQRRKNNYLFIDEVQVCPQFELTVNSLHSSEKYDIYVTGSNAFCYAKLGTRNMDYGRMIENIVAIELMRRGYEIYAGVLYKKEIDFVAMKHDEKLYIQVSDDISGESTFAREVDPLLQIKDAYPKMLIARTKHEDYQYEGIRIVDVANWLKEK